jgi:hypothetical protein
MDSLNSLVAGADADGGGWLLTAMGRWWSGLWDLALPTFIGVSYDEKQC